MTLLDFARGPALQWAAVIFVIGMLWRIGGLVFLMRNKVASKNRDDRLYRGGWHTLFSRFLPAPVFRRRVGLQYAASWVWHLGFLIVLLFFSLHIQFIKGIVGFEWPALPNGLIVFVAGVTAGVLVFLLVRRIVNPVLRYISTFDDYSSVIVTLLPLITGLATYSHVLLPYQTLLSLHFLSIALLLVWFPFSKLFHVITVLPSRYILGVKFWRRGVEV